MSNRGGELAHGSDAVGMRQLALHLAILPLTAGALQRNGRLRGEVRDQVNLRVGERLYLGAGNTDCTNQLIFLEHRHEEQCPSAERFGPRELTISRLCCHVGDVDRRSAFDESSPGTAWKHGKNAPLVPAGIVRNWRSS